jgi:hypothetical protein
MQIREALILQSPSLCLQRAALDEISRLDALVLAMQQQIERLKAESQTHQLTGA